MNDLATKLRTSSSLVAINQRAIDNEVAAMRLENDSRDRFGKIDVEQLGAKLSQQSGVDPHMLRAVSARLSPVEAGKLARLIDLSGARFAPSPAVAPSGRLTPVQQGENERLKLMQDIGNTRITPQNFGLTNEYGSISDRVNGVILDANKYIADTISRLQTPEKKEPIPGERDPDDDVRPTSPPPPPSSGAGQVPTSPPPPPSSGAGDPYRTPPQSLTDQAHRQLQEEAPATNVSALFGRTNDDKFNMLTDVTTGETSSPWANALNGFKDGAIGAIPNEKARVVAAFGTGLVEGVGGGFLDAGKGIAKLAFNAAQFYEDNSIAGAAFDELRGVTGTLPKWLDAIIPSQQRGIETIHYAEQVADNIGAYFSSRAQDPSLLRDDVKQFLSSNWNALKDDHAAARAKGAVAEAEWWGKTIGRGAFEVAATINAAGDVARLAKAAAGATKLAFEAGVAFSATKLSEIKNFATEMAAAARLASRDSELGLATLENLEEAQPLLNDAKLFGRDAYGSTAEGKAAYNAVATAEREVADAIYKIKSPVTLSTSGNENVRLGSQLAGWANQLEDPAQATRFGNSAAILIKSASVAGSPQLTDLAKLTARYGDEFAMFKRGNQTVLIRGNPNGIDLPPSLVKRIEENKGTDNPWVWVAHSQPGYNSKTLTASTADQEILKLTGQERSTIVNSRGQKSEFTTTSTLEKVGYINAPKNFTDATAFNKAANDPAALTRYNHNDYYYETDSRGRVEFAGGKIKVEAAGRNDNGLQTAIGKEGHDLGHPDDVGFHLIGDQFGGQTNRLNVVPGNGLGAGNLNTGAYAKFERTIKTLANRPNTKVEVQMRAFYKEGNLTNRPDSFIVSYRSITTSPGQLYPQWTPWAQQSFVNK